MNKTGDGTELKRQGDTKFEGKMLRIVVDDFEFGGKIRGVKLEVWVYWVNKSIGKTVKWSLNLDYILKRWVQGRNIKIDLNCSWGSWID